MLWIFSLNLEAIRLPQWLVFAVQNFLDAHHVIGGDTPRALTELQTGVALIEASLAQDFKISTRICAVTWPLPMTKA